MAFMDDTEQPCEVCGGSGFNPEVLQYQYHHQNIVEVMNMTVLEAKKFYG
jgi:excinuclease UvrABC ATPase subunit